jgi:zinc protease
MMLQPEIKELLVPQFPQAELMVLSNGIHVYGFNGALNDVLRLDMVFDSGRWVEDRPLTAEATAKLFKAGNIHRDAFAIETAIDSLGATIKASTGYHGFSISLYVMRRHLKEALELLLECFFEATFPAKELDIHKRNAIAKLKVSQEKPDFLAEMAWKELIFGVRHPYGYRLDEAYIEDLQHGHLVAFFEKHIRGILPDIYVAGRYAESDIAIISKALSVLQPQPRQEDIQHKVEPSPERRVHIHKPGASQVSVMSGKRLFNKQHPDYAAFVLMNTVFGGYFGSRLMLNIREEKGYTYGIYSSLQTYRHDAAFYIQTDTGKEYLSACMEEIKKECIRMQEEPVSDYELRQARNYLMGKFLTRMDGPFAQMETYKNYSIEGLNMEMFDNFASIIAQTDAAAIQQLAQRHLDFESFHEVIVGA